MKTITLGLMIFVCAFASFSVMISSGDALESIKLMALACLLLSALEKSK